MNVSEQPGARNESPLTPCSLPPEGEGGVRGSGERDIATAKWQEVESRWKAVLGLEATIDTLRMSMEGARTELEASLRRGLTTEEKLNALQADVVQWNKAKSRIHYAVPKANEFIHHAVWAKGTPERKKLDEFFKNALTPPPQEEGGVKENAAPCPLPQEGEGGVRGNATSPPLPQGGEGGVRGNAVGAHIPLSQMDKVLEELENWRKDLQVLSTRGVTIFQECKGISADVQASLRRLQSNAAARPARKKGATGAKGKLPF